MLTLVRISLFALCGVVGYISGRTIIYPSPPMVVGEGSSAAPKVADELIPATAAESVLIAEWEKLRGTRAAGPAELPELYSEVKGIKDAFRRRAFRSALLAEWAVSDPKAALAFLGQKDTRMVTQLLREWMRVDPNGAVTALLTGDENHRGRISPILNDIAKLAPDRLAEAVTALPESQSRWDSSAEEAFAIFAQRDPVAARRAAESVTGPHRSQALFGVAKSWAEQDGTSALAWAQAMPAGEDRDGAIRAVLVGWAKTDPFAALAKIDLVPPGGDESHASDVAAQVLGVAGKKDWEGTIRWLRENPGKVGLSGLSGLQEALSHWLSVDPSKTMNAMATSGVFGIDHALGNVLLNDGYAQRDHVQRWIEQQPATDFTRRASSWLINAVACKDPDAALALLEEMPDTTENRAHFQYGTATILNGRGQMNRFEHYLSSASEKLRPLLLSAGFELGLEGEVRDLGPWIRRIDELPEERRANASGAVARNWAMSDPEGAIKWALDLPTGAQRETAFTNAAGSWAEQDTYGASRWIDTLPPGSNRDTATQSLVGALSTSQPETAWQWALSIDSDAVRLSALQAAYLGLRQKNPGAAEQMLGNANLPAAHRAALEKSTAP